MLIEIESDLEFFTLLEMLKTEGRELYTLWHPRGSDRWLWKVDVEGGKTDRGLVQPSLDLSK